MRDTVRCKGEGVWEETKEKKVTKKEKHGYIDAAFGLAGGIGAFALVRGLAKAVVTTKDPVTAIGLFTIEIVAGCSWGLKSARFVQGIKKGIEYVREEMEKEEEADSDDLRDDVSKD